MFEISLRKWSSVSIGDLHGDSDLVSCIEVLDFQPASAKVGVAPLSSHVAMPSSPASVRLCPYLGHFEGYLCLHGPHAGGGSLVRTQLAFICNCSSVPREVTEQLCLLEPSPPEAWGGGTDGEIKILSLPYQLPQKPVSEAVLTPSQPGCLNISIFSTAQASKSQVLRRGFKNEYLLLLFSL